MRNISILTSMIIFLKDSWCLPNTPTSELTCLGRILQNYGTLYSCPWDITSSCMTPNFICYKNDSLCGERTQQLTVISIVVTLTSIPILKNEKIITSSQCPCGKTEFNCHITLNDTTGIPELCKEDNLAVSTTTIVTTEYVRPSNESSAKTTCSPSKSTSTAGEIIGALFGGIVLGVLVVFISYFGTKWYRNAKPKQATRTSELGTENPAYGSTPYTDSIDQQLKSRPRNASHVYTTINDNTPKVSHVKPIVRGDQDDSATYSETYSRLNESERKERDDNYDHAGPTPSISNTPMNDYDSVKPNSIASAPAMNEYTEVVGDGFLNHGDNH